MAALPAHLPAGARLALPELKDDFHQFPWARGRSSCLPRETDRQTDGRTFRHTPPSTHHLDFSVLRYYFLGQVTSSSCSHLILLYTTYHVRSAAVEDQDEIILVFKKKRQEKEEFGGSSPTAHQTEYPQVCFPFLHFLQSSHCLIQRELPNQRQTSC